MKHGNKNRSNTRKMLNNNNVHTHARRHARAYPPPPPPAHSISHTHTHIKQPTVSQVKSPPKSIQIGKRDTADYGDSKLIKLFSFNYKGMILLLPSQRTIEGRQVLSSVEVTGHRHSAVTVP